MKKQYLFWCIILCLHLFNMKAKAQQNVFFSDDEILQGAAHRDKVSFFIFQAGLYDEVTTQVKQVNVTGSFRGWSTDMNDTKWQLKQRKDKLWVLSFENPNLNSIPPGAQFKFRINEGQWLTPTAKKFPNEEGGNLIFLKGQKKPQLRAEINKNGTIWAFIEGFGLERPLSPAGYKLTNAQGQEVPIAEVYPNTKEKTLLKPATAINHKKVYFLELVKEGLKTAVSFDGWFREVLSHKEMGANISADGKKTDIRIFVPRAESVKLYLFKNHTDKEAYQTIEMKVDDDGVWEATINENLKGVYYDFTVHGAKEEGNFFYETVPVHISDPYTRVSVDSFGKGRIWERTKPATPLKNGRPKMQDVIAYEVHIEDFTNQLPLPENLRGTIPAFHKTGLKNKKGAKIGFDYLTDLGINTVHLLPMQEFLHWQSKDWQESFKNDKFMQEQGIDKEWYEWGYRTTHAFAVENRYRQKGGEFGTERNQFRDLVQAFHDKGLAVIIDIVPNHTGENMDGQDLYLHFNAIDKQYYYRTKNLKHIGEYGNEVKTENRPMTQKWLIDQCKHWIDEFGIDGFRIDLAGQVDQQTLIKLREAVGQDVIIYGEPWIGSNDPEFENNPDWDWYKIDAPITFFQDDARNAFKGAVSNPENKQKDRGYAGGDSKAKEKVKLGLTAKFPEEKSPLSGINYLDIHDNWALADQFATKNWDGRMGVDEDNYKIAAVLLYTSQGPIVTHGGSEMMRSKGLAELKETVKTTNAGIKIYIHGKRDTYNMRNANLFLWENVGKTKGESGSFCDYKNMYAFWRGLNLFRASKYGQVFRNDKAIPDGYYEWINTKNDFQLGYLVAQEVLVLINTEEKNNVFEKVSLPSGNWRLVANNQAVDHEKGVKDKDKSLEKLAGSQSHTINMPPLSIKIWVKD
ncbi:MAG: pullulanase [Bacteroidetes bacterium]|nr:MAG: pullulanase [Bacteroidota bacterium]TAG89660.1 MAG: pullulanase [Bacteroidota bacterium]